MVYLSGTLGHTVRFFLIFQKATPPTNRSQLFQTFPEVFFLIDPRPHKISLGIF